MKQQPIKIGRDLMITIVIALFSTVAAYGAALSVEDPLGIIAAIYGVAYLGLAWRFPHMALAVAIAAAPFQNDVSSGLGPFRMSVGEISLTLCFFVYLLRWIMKHCEMKHGPYMTAMIVYLAICMSSSLANWSDTAMTSFLQMILYFIIAPMVFANFVKQVESLTIALYLLVGVCVFLAMYGLASGTFYIFGLHKNGVGSSLACGITVCTELFLVQTNKVRKGLLFAAIFVISAGLIFSLSRGAWLGALAGFFVVIGTRGKLKFMLQATVVLVPMIVLFWNMLPAEKRDYAASFDPNRENISARYKSIDFARNTFTENPIFGVGVGLRKEFDATNIFWVTLAETGVQGLVAFGAIHVICLLMIFRTQKFVSRSDPRFSLLVLGGALLFAKVIHGVVDHYWSRGALLIAWACCGMGTGIYFNEQERLKRLKIKIMKSRRVKPRAQRPQTIGQRV